MMNILFLSQNAPGFSTLRSNHIREFLHNSKRYTVHEVSLTPQNIYEDQLHTHLLKRRAGSIPSSSQDAKPSTEHLACGHFYTAQGSECVFLSLMTKV